VSSNRDFGVEQIFRADAFRADDPSPFETPTDLAKGLNTNLSPFFLQSEKN